MKSLLTTRFYMKRKVMDSTEPPKTYVCMCVSVCVLRILRVNKTTNIKKKDPCNKDNKNIRETTLV